MKTSILLAATSILLSGCLSAGPDAPIRQITTPQGMTDQEYSRQMDQEYMRARNNRSTVIIQQQRRSTWVDMQPTIDAMGKVHRGN